MSLLNTVRVTPVVLCLACASWNQQRLPRPISDAPSPTGRLLAGAAQVEITPPPGLGLAGSGPEGRIATGYRTRLHARALVLQDAEGQRIGLVVVDLAHVSANLHRLVAARLQSTKGIGADRLILSATHTHSGPAHFYGERGYNDQVSRLPGYDPRVVDFLVSRISAAVEQAVTRLEPAAVAIGTTDIQGATFNRSIEAFRRNPATEQARLCHPCTADNAVDGQLLMIRIDRQNDLTGVHTPIGSWSVFAIHGTAIPSLNTLYDGDIHARVVERLMEPNPGGGEVVHLLANGAEGDAAPRVLRHGCNLPRIGALEAAPMPRGPGPAPEWRDPPRAVVESCLDSALAEIERLADRVAEPAKALFERLGSQLSSAVPIRRAFATAYLPGSDGLCPTPVVGSAAAAGAEQLETRVRGWDWIFPGLIRLAAVEGDASVDIAPGHCQSPKRTLLGPLQSRMIGDHGFPDVAQVTVLRIGDALLVAMPAELTAMAGFQVRDSMRAAAAEEPKYTAIIGLANGFLQYVTTEEEYQWQAYEGGSTLYGPNSVAFLARRAAELTRQLTETTNAVVIPIDAFPGPAREILPSPSDGPAAITPRLVSQGCQASRVVFEWLDLSPGRLMPTGVPWVALEIIDGNEQPHKVAADGDGRLELQAVADRGGAGTVWRARWRRDAAPGRYRLSQLRGPVAQVIGEVSCYGEIPSR